jgi:hypothetical protein
MVPGIQSESIKMKKPPILRERQRVQRDTDDLRVLKLKTEDPWITQAGIARELGWIRKSGTLARVKVGRVVKRIQNRLQVN